MKKLLLLLVSMVALVGVAPAFIGRHVEQQYEKALGKVAAAYPWLKVSTLSYEKKWFRTRAVTAVELTGPLIEGPRDENPVVPQRLELVHDMYHGPLILDGKTAPRLALLMVKSRLRLRGEDRKRAAKAFHGKEPLSVRTTQTLSGRYQVDLDTSEGAYNDRDTGTTFRLKPARGHLRIDPLAGTCRGRVVWPGLTVAGQDRGHLQITGLLYTVDYAQDSGPFRLGTAALKLQEVASTEAEGLEMRLQGLKMRTKTGKEQDLLHLAAELTLEKLSVNGTDYGPGTLALEARNLEAQTLAAFLSRQQALHAQLQTAATAEARQELTARFGKATLALLPALLIKGPRLEITKLRLATPQGEISGRAAVKVDTSQPRMLEQIATALLTLKAEAQLRVPKPLVAETPLGKQAPGWRTAGFISEENGQYVFSGRFDTGQLTMNGKLVQR